MPKSALHTSMNHMRGEVFFFVMAPNLKLHGQHRSTRSGNEEKSNKIINC